jgi:cytoskeletal protein CcmA (bactofilin family)
MAMTSGPAANPMPGAGGAQGGRSHLIAGTRIVGDISAPGLLEIQGQVEGRVIADSVVIEERGLVNGEVQAAAIGVKGTFSGHLAGGAVRIHATARLSGTIRYETLSVESGSEITASCERASAGASVG